MRKRVRPLKAPEAAGELDIGYEPSETANAVEATSWVSVSLFLENFIYLFGCVEALEILVAACGI